MSISTLDQSGAERKGPHLLCGVAQPTSLALLNQPRADSPTQPYPHSHHRPKLSSQRRADDPLIPCRVQSHVEQTRQIALVRQVERRKLLWRVVEKRPDGAVRCFREHDLGRPRHVQKHRRQFGQDLTDSRPVDKRVSQNVEFGQVG